MSLLKFITFLCFLISTCLLQSHFGASSLYSFCSTSGNFTSNDPFDINSKELMGYFYYEMEKKDFALGSKGHGQDQVHGLAICCGGVSTKDCRACIMEANNEIMERCTYSKLATMWNENCFLKYSNKSFYGQIENQKSFIVHGAKNANMTAEVDVHKLRLMSNLANKTLLMPKLYATGELQVNGSVTVYGLAQFTRDLSSYDCEHCLSSAISTVQIGCIGNKGARVYTETCSLRYEV